MILKGFDPAGRQHRHPVIQLRAITNKRLVLHTILGFTYAVG